MSIYIQVNPRRKMDHQGGSKFHNITSRQQTSSVCTWVKQIILNRLEYRKNPNTTHTRTSIDETFKFKISALGHKHYFGLLSQGEVVFNSLAEGENTICTVFPPFKNYTLSLHCSPAQGGQFIGVLYPSFCSFTL